MRIVRLALGVGFITLISRILGYVRDILIAFFLGASALNDIFIIALRLPNMFRTIFAEGALSAAFIPMLSKNIKRRDDRQIISLIQGTQNILLLALLVFSVVMMLLMPYVVGVIAPGYADNESMVYLAIELSRIAFPYIIFISLMAFYGGVSNCYGNYFYFASAPIWLNLVLIVSILFGESELEKVYYLSYGLLIAGIIEMLWVYRFVYKKFGYISFFKISLDDDIKELLRKILPGIFGSGIVQINILISTVLASFVSSGISYLYYADRIYQLPLALIGTALGTVMLPELAKKVAHTDRNKFKALQNQAYVLSLFLSLPAAMALVALSEDIVSVLFEYGNFTHDATLETAFALRIFGVALPLFILMKILVSSFFALGDTKTPVKISAISLLINIAVGVVFLPFLRHGSIALGALLSSCFVVCALLYLLDKKGYLAIYRQVFIRSLKLMIASVLMLIAMLVVNYFMSIDNKIISLSINLISGGAVYLLANQMLGGFRIRKLYK